ncbi:FimV family protein [Sedimenticola hydrogenitrophicus]|uniref:type IV pilus assembly protein FimV n=1 Tax=Sedimenticola hydrogenitrophicus TaxID=2967975 RepID=UPI0023B01BAC|nr:FimV/HubP family polar landmark protein [Sedimenticola hydrogenitrophicus]
MIRKPLLSLLLLIPSASAFALGLGGIQVDSALNEPLDARVRLISVEQMAIDDIRVRLAAPNDFKRAGLDRPLLLSRLRFQPVFPEDGDAYIRVSTRETIREPFLDFLLEISWPQGSLVREFTILLDPPTYQPPRAESVAAPRARPQPAPSRPSPAATSYGPVQRTDTLWLIAGKVQPDARFSRNRIMIALLKANPEAFHRGNINLLKRGALLTIPTPGEMAAVTEAEARAAVRQQMAEWREGRRSATAASRPGPEEPQPVAERQPAASESQPGADQPAVSTPAAVEEPATPAAADRELTAEERQRLRVVEPERNWQVTEKSEAGYPAQESDKLREAIRDSEQELVAVQEINKDIIELRAALESKVDALKKALAEKDAQLENLRQQIAQAGGTGGSVKPEPGSATDATGTLAVAAPPQGNVAVSAPVTEISPLAAGWKNEYWMMLMGAIIVILSTLLLLNRRGRQRETRFETPELFEMSSGTTAPGEKGSAQPAAWGDQRAAAPMTPLKEPLDTAPQDAEALPETRNDVASVLMEADIYLAYRRYSQAESLVEEAMEQNPESLELKAKRLEIYAFRRDKKAFTQYLDQVYPVLMLQAPELWEKVEEMGRHLVPEHTAWQSDATTEVIPPVAPGEYQEGLGEEAEEEEPSELDPFDIDIELEDLDISGGESEPVSFDDLIKKDYPAGEDDIPSIDIDVDLDFDNLDDLPKDK